MFTVKPVKTQTLGEYLVSCREHLGLSREEIARIAKIQPKYVAALESGNYSELPPAVYVKGFLKSLAEIYHANEQSIMQQFEAERGLVENLQIIEKPEKIPLVSPFVLSPRTLAVAAVALVGLASLSYLYFQVSSLGRPPKLVLEFPLASGPVESSLMVVAGLTEPGSSVYLNSQAIVVDANGQFWENLSLGPGSNQIVIKSVNKFGRESVLTRSIFLAPKEIVGIQGATTTAAMTEGINFEIVVGPRDSRVEIEVDGRDEYSGTMSPGSARKFNARERVVLSTGDAGSTRVILNGKDLGFLGQDGETLRDLEFTK